MSLQLEHIFAGKRMGSRKIQRDALIQDFAVEWGAEKYSAMP